jgi:hypothetical protein
MQRHPTGCKLVDASPILCLDESGWHECGGLMCFGTWMMVVVVHLSAWSSNICSSPICSALHLMYLAIECCYSLCAMLTRNSSQQLYSTALKSLHPHILNPFLHPQAFVDLSLYYPLYMLENTALPSPFEGWILCLTTSWCPKSFRLGNTKR